ncbi:MAG: class E sortase [Oscillospiraceae bacterium]|nr:class E sortase [Oscillospiraceae bacterium]
MIIRRVRVILGVLIILTAVAAVFEITRPYRPDNPLDSFVDEVIGRDPLGYGFEDEEFPVYLEIPFGEDVEGFRPVSGERLDYIEGEIRLIIPALDFDKVVQDGTSQAALKKGPGLFESSAMPGQQGANVSIAGHRNRETFYYLDRVGKDDRVYLIYNQNVYTYVFYDSIVVLPSRWDVISEQEFEACTLITCTPIRVANKRMVVRFKLESIAGYESYS